MVFAYSVCVFFKGHARKVKGERGRERRALEVCSLVGSPVTPGLYPDRGATSRDIERVLWRVSCAFENLGSRTSTTSPGRPREPGVQGG